MSIAAYFKTPLSDRWSLPHVVLEGESDSRAERVPDAIKPVREDRGPDSVSEEGLLSDAIRAEPFIVQCLQDETVYPGSLGDLATRCRRVHRAVLGVNRGFSPVGTAKAIITASRLKPGHYLGRNKADPVSRPVWYTEAGYCVMLLCKGTNPKTKTVPREERDCVVGSGTFKTVTNAVDLRTGQVWVVSKQRGRDKKHSQKMTQEFTLARRYAPVGSGPIEGTFKDKKGSPHQFTCIILSPKHPFDLSKRLQLPMTFPEKVAIAKQCAAAVAVLHYERRAHFDIKSENFLITDDERCVLTDFWFAAYPGLVNDARGSPRYMAPEMIHELYARGIGKPEKLMKSYPADVWSLGVVFYELFVGRAPVWIEVLPQQGLVPFLHTAFLDAKRDIPKFLQEKVRSQIPVELPPAIGDLLAGMLHPRHEGAYPDSRLNMPEVVQRLNDLPIQDHD